MSTFICLEFGISALSKYSKSNPSGTILAIQLLLREFHYSLMQI